MFIHNNRIDLKHTKNYATQEAAIKAVEKVFGSAAESQEFDLIVIVKDDRHVPIVRWNQQHTHRMLDSAHRGFYTIA